MGAEDEAAETSDPPPSSVNGKQSPLKSKHTAAEVETDAFGLPSKDYRTPRAQKSEAQSDEEDGDTFHDAQDVNNRTPDPEAPEEKKQSPVHQGQGTKSGESPEKAVLGDKNVKGTSHSTSSLGNGEVPNDQTMVTGDGINTTNVEEQSELSTTPLKGSKTSNAEQPTLTTRDTPSPDPPTVDEKQIVSPKIKRERQSAGPAISEWSHQRLAPQAEVDQESEEEEEWKPMPALGEYDIYDENNRLVARAAPLEDEEAATYQGLGSAAKGYTRVQLDEDAQSANSMDEDTSYLFKEGHKTAVVEEEEQRDATAQLEATKDLLTEGQRIAYVGVVRLAIYEMVTELEGIDATKVTKKLFSKALEGMEKWGQLVMVRLYGHMEIDSAEQLMIEQLAAHGVQPRDLVPPLMQNARVKNPMAEETPTPQCEPLSHDQSPESARDNVSVDARQTSEAGLDPPAYREREGGPAPEAETSETVEELKTAGDSEPLPEYNVHDREHVPDVQSPLHVPHTAKIDIDIRWTVLCDLFLMLISDGTYDARSRLLLERVASAMEISWVQLCRFEKRVTDALEMQEEAAKENWNEADHMERRRKMGLKRKYMFMGLATVGGGLVIGLSAGLLAPLIGAGLAAGFTTIGVTGTAGFLGGVGGAALITSAAATTGGVVAVRASHRRTGAVTTFEYRPLHNNKRVNLILTVSGWMNGKVDDVRLPYSTVDPIMGDIYSLLWEPEMLQSMGDTINILATEALTQTVQQVLGSTILTALMASIQLPIILTKLSYLIDNPWSVSLDRANSAGQILADSLIDRHLGNRPITLLGFSLGSRVIFSCLRELAARGAYGLVQNVYLFGSPIVAKREEYLRARSVISGRFVNGYSSNDWILGYLFRATSGGIMRVAGLAPVLDIPGLENLDVTALVNGHMAYRATMPKLLREVGWEVESDEFTEIEDPDPDNHEKRQRELIREIDEARKEAEIKPEKRRFGFFKRGKLAEKKGWETYDPSSMKPGHTRTGSDSSLGEGGVLFDIDAIRRELESEMIEVRELDSTLPPMQIKTKANDGPLPTGAPSAAALLAHQGLDPEEIAKMRLPPRPDEIEDDHQPTANGKEIEQRTKTSFDPDFDFPEPKELKSTLPPLTLSPSLPQTSQSDPPSVPPTFRPGLKTHSTTPNFHAATHSESRAAPTQNFTSATADQRLAMPTPSFAALNLEHNAWADEDEDFGKEKEIKMSFE
jgi:hypothetical protein